MNTPGFEKKETMVVLRSLLHRVLCFRSVCFLFSPFCFVTISLISQFSHVLLNCLPSVFLLAVASLPPPFSSPLLFGSSSGFYSERTHAFLVSRRASRWRGMSAAIHALLDLKMALLSLLTSSSFIIKIHSCWRQWNALQWKRRRLGSSGLVIEVFAIL